MKGNIPKTQQESNDTETKLEVKKNLKSRRQKVKVT